MSKMKLLISFDDRSAQFVEGVEFGGLFQKLKSGEEKVSNCGFPIRLTNQELVNRACEIYGYAPEFKECSASGWVEFKATKL